MQKLCKKKVTTIYNPSFDKKILNFIKKKKNSDTKIILNVARFEKQKNHSMLLESFKDIHNQVNANLLLVGYGAEKKKISNFINKNKLNNRIIIVKDYINVFKYYKIADLFVLTSLYEGFGNVLVEAGIFKIPIISTDCKSGPKEILNNGKYGDLVKIGQTKKLSKLILKNLKFPNKNKITKMYKSLKDLIFKIILMHMKKSLKKFRNNIIFFCPSIEEGGVEKNLINISNGLSYNHNVSLITANKNKKKFFNKKINFISSKSDFFNNKSRITKSIYCCYLLYKYSKNNKATIISFQANVSAILASKILGYRVIIRSNQSPIFYAKNFLKRKLYVFF